jgi:hypothetical protein
MELSYLQNCPSCGAPVELAEADRVVECSYCDGMNYMVNSGPLRFILPDNVPATVGKENLFYFPYLRFKGQIYSCLDQDLEHKIVDTTQLGCSDIRLPVSLGLRPQAMKVRLISAEHQGRFVRLTEKVVDIFNKAAQLSAAFSEDSKKLYHRSFIGETISFIYLPTYIKGTTLVDGVLNRQISRRVEPALLDSALPSNAKWLPRFIPTTCPHCAASMQGEKDSLVMHCRNCQTFWSEQKGRFEKVDYSVIDGGRQKIHLPFWQINVHAEGVQLESYADFIRTTNQPLVPQPEDAETDFVFLVPAFKIRPKYFLKLAKNMTTSQRKLIDGKQVVPKRIFPVTLPPQEGVQALKAILTATVADSRNFIPQLPRIRLQSKRIELLYLPFHSLGQDLVQDQTSMAISRKILYFGRTM